MLAKVCPECGGSLSLDSITKNFICRGCGLYAPREKFDELQEKLNEQETLDKQASLINNNTIPFVLRPTQDNSEGFSISKIPLAKIFKLDNKAIREVKKTFGLLLDNNNIPKTYTISKIDPLMIKKWLAIVNILLIFISIFIYCFISICRPTNCT